MAPPKGDDSLLEQIHLVEPTILFFLRFYLRPDRLLIHPNSGNKIPSGPKMVTHKILSLPKIHPGVMFQTNQERKGVSLNPGKKSFLLLDDWPLASAL